MTILIYNQFVFKKQFILHSSLRHLVAQSAEADLLFFTHLVTMTAFSSSPPCSFTRRISHDSNVHLKLDFQNSVESYKYAINSNCQLIFSLYGHT
jgi:hypothetical protein